MRIALYQGTGFISKAIRWQTRSKYSHAAFLFDDGTVIEAWTGGVREVDPYWHRVWKVSQARKRALFTAKYSALSRQHAPGTKVDIFGFCDPIGKVENRALEMMARKAVGTPYDYAGIICFLTREKDPARGKVFCSELVFGLCEKIERRLLERIAPSCVSPGHIALSPLLKLEEPIVTV